MEKELIKQIYGDIDEKFVEIGAKKILKVINNLPPLERDIFTSLYITKLPFKEVASILGITPKKLKGIELRAIGLLEQPETMKRVFISDFEETMQKLQNDFDDYVEEYQNEIREMENVCSLLKLITYNQLTNILLEQGVELLKLETVIERALKISRIHTIKDLLNKTENELLNIRYIGKTRLEKLKFQLAKKGLKLKD